MVHVPAIDRSRFDHPRRGGSVRQVARFACVVSGVFLVLAAGGCSFDARQPNQIGSGTGGQIGGDGSVASDFPIRNTDLVNAADVAIGNDDAAPCSQVLRAVVRDFRGFAGPNGEPKHPDFQYATGDDRGIAAQMLGSDSKPVYAPTAPTRTTHTAADFDQWYRDTPDVNMRFETEIALTAHPTKTGTFVYDSDSYFPLDNMGFGNQSQNHNFHFTTELHFEFPYRGGETFTFRGDDDLWLFVNGKRAVDIGGVHTAQTGTVNLDQQAAALGITPGQVYRMDIFGAERHTSQSTFHIETTLQCVVNIVIP